MKISVSTLDSFQYYLDNDKSQDDFIQELITRRESRPMNIGIAFENILQQPENYFLYTHYEYKGIRFETEQINACLDYINSFKATWQVKMTKEYDTDYGLVTLSGKTDILHGLIIEDIKTTANYSYDKYANSWQWRCYLDMFDIDNFVYYIAEIKDGDEMVFIKDTHIIKLSGYDNMNNDIRTILNKFVQFILDNNLGKYFGYDSNIIMV